MRTVLRLLPIALFAVGISGCGVFGGKDEELPPKELADFEQTLDVRKVWSAKLGKGSELLRVQLLPAGDGRRVYAASHDGKVTAFDPESGKALWKTELELRLSAGPGVGNGLVVVAGSDGHVVALRGENGSEVWRTNVRGESLAVPLIKDNIVVVYSIDGSLRALSTASGAELWLIEQSLPALTLRGTATPLIVGRTVIAGFDNGRLLAANLDDGVTEWEAMMSPPTGRSDLERLSDIDGHMAAVGQDVYAAGYQGRLASLAAESGQVLWAREISSFSGIGADWNNVYVAADNGELIALSRKGDEMWRQDALLRRTPTAPVPYNNTVVVGDFEGYVHFFNNTDGTPVARLRAGKGMISGAPVVDGTRLLVQSEDGTLTAFAVNLPKRPGNGKDVAAKTG